MGQMVIRQLDDAALARLKLRAKANRTSAEALAREAIHRAAQLTLDEKRELALQMQDWGRRAVVAGVKQTPTIELIREDRDR